MSGSAKQGSWQILRHGTWANTDAVQQKRLPTVGGHRRDVKAAVHATPSQPPLRDRPAFERQINAKCARTDHPFRALSNLRGWGASTREGRG